MFHYVPKDYPTDPGVYLMKSAQGKVLYVGKAKNLRARLGSYFRGEIENAKTRLLVERIAGIDVLLTSTEKEALLLEASLISKHRPRFNIVIRDDKSYILFKLDKTHAFPKIVFTRRVVRDGSAYFGPFTSSQAARQTFRELGKLFPLRKCRNASFSNRVRPCLYNSLGQCMGPCVGNVTEEDYDVLVRRVEAFLSGRSGEVIRRLEREMQRASEALRFERAAELRDLLAAMKITIEGQAVVLRAHTDIDVLNVFAADTGLGLSVLFVRQGRLLDRANFFWPGFDMDELTEALPIFLTQFYRSERFIPAKVLMPQRLYALLEGSRDDSADGGSSTPAEVVADILAERRGGPVRLAAPRSREERSLVEMAETNASRAVLDASAVHEEQMPALLGRKLHLGREIRRIEAVDVSHLGGKGMRVGMVVYEEDRFKKEDYRIYALDELEGSADDYAALARWVERRISSGEPWPDLVLIDGGKGQLAAVERAMLQAGMPNLWECAAIVKSGRSKNARDDLIYRPGRKNPMPLRSGSRELLFLQRLRDAVHDFTVGRQRVVRKKTAMKSEILSLPGVGPKTAKLLWDRFGTLEAMRVATLEDVLAIPGLGPKKGSAILEMLRAL